MLCVDCHRARLLPGGSVRKWMHCRACQKHVGVLFRCTRPLREFTPRIGRSNLAPLVSIVCPPDEEYELVQWFVLNPWTKTDGEIRESRSNR